MKNCPDCVGTGLSPAGRELQRHTQALMWGQSLDPEWIQLTTALAGREPTMTVYGSIHCTFDEIHARAKIVSALGLGDIYKADGWGVCKTCKGEGEIET